MRAESSHRSSGEPMLPRGLAVSTVTVPPGRIRAAALRLAEERGWLRHGWCWARAGDRPERLTADGRAVLIGVPPGTPVEFAARIRVVALAPGEIDSPAADGEVWLNAPRDNFTQRSQ